MISLVQTIFDLKGQNKFTTLILESLQYQNEKLIQIKTVSVQ